MRPRRILVLCGVGPFGGASRSLYESLRAMPAGAAEFLLVAARGTSVPFYRQVARDLVEVRGLTRFDNTRYSHYRGLRWLVLLRELSHLPSTVLGLLRARRRWGRVDCIHANEITELIPLAIARWLFRAPTVVHVRSLQRRDPASWRTRRVDAALARADVVVAIDENVRATLPPDLVVDVVHNSFAPEAERHDGALETQLAALPPSTLRVGFVGNLLLVKGLLELLEAVRRVRTTGRDVSVLVVGGSLRNDGGIRRQVLRRLGLAQDVSDQVTALLRDPVMQGAVHLVGATAAIGQAYRRMHVLCFPSHLDAPGRPVFEAACFGVPSIVAVREPRPDTLVPGETGLAIPSPDPGDLAAAIEYLCDRPHEVQRLGANARALAARNFSPARNAQALLAIYERVTRSHPR